PKSCATWPSWTNSSTRSCWPAAWTPRGPTSAPWKRWTWWVCAPKSARGWGRGLTCPRAWPSLTCPVCPNCCGAWCATCLKTRAGMGRVARMHSRAVASSCPCNPWARRSSLRWVTTARACPQNTENGSLSRFSVCLGPASAWAVWAWACRW
ncbi:Uncharacterized protein APZ42_003147, partial [Daphnia magna]